MFISRFIQANYFKKYLAENAVNTISEPLDFKIFRGEFPQTPYKLASPAPTKQSSRTYTGYELWRDHSYLTRPYPGYILNNE